MRTEVISHTVWINDEAKIASFHFVEGYQEKEFCTQDFFIGFLQSLVEHGYRFQ